MLVETLDGRIQERKTVLVRRFGNGTATLEVRCDFGSIAHRFLNGISCFQRTHELRQSRSRFDIVVDLK